MVGLPGLWNNFSEQYTIFEIHSREPKKIPTYTKNPEVSREHKYNDII